ncbi:MAG: sigma-E factor negative regulatory protein RseA [Lentisphaeria bacterium]|jgi:sigma-E factor negative regulatory protein RseA
MTKSPNSSVIESVSALIDGESNDSDVSQVLDSIDTRSAGREEARAKWERYQLIRSVIKRDCQHSPVDLSVAISAIIQTEEQDPIVSLEDQALQGGSAQVTPVNGAWVNAWSKWRDVMGKTAIAATVAFGFVIGVQQFNGYSAGSGALVANNAKSGAESSSGAIAHGVLPGSSVPEGFELPSLSARTVSSSTFDVGTRSGSRNSSPIRAGEFAQGALVIHDNELQNHINRLMYKHSEQSASSGSMGVIPFARVSELQSEPQEEGE